MKHTIDRRPLRYSLFGLCSLLTLVGTQWVPTQPAHAQDETPNTPAKTRREVRRENREGTAAPQQAAADQQGKRAWIGIQLQDGNDQQGQSDDDKDKKSDKDAKKSEKGVVVSGVYPNGPAARGGIRHGDRLQSINGKPVSSSKEVTEVIRSLQPATNAQIIVDRQGTAQTLTVTLGDAAFHPQQGQSGQQPYAQQVNGQQGYAQQGYGQQGNGFAQGNGFPQGTAYGQGQDGIPEHAMMLEYNRRNSEQHERMESQIEELLKEVQSLRKEVQALKAK